MATLRNDTVIKNADGQATSAIITAANIVNHAAGKISSSDTRSVVTTPQTIDKGTVFDFKQNSTESLSDGGTYFGQMTFRPYGTGTDWSGTLSHQLGFADSGNIWQRSGSSTTWGAWKKILNSSNYSGYALPLSGGTLTGGLSGTTAAFSGQITNTIATGTAPFAITSTTLVSNLNVQYLNGQLGGYYAAASSLASYLPLAGGTLTGELVINYAAGRQRIIDGANALIMGHWDTVNVRIEASGRPLYMVSYGGAISIGRSSGSNLVVDTASVSYGGNTVLHAGNYTSYPDATKLPLTGGALTGAITVNGVSDAVVVQTNGNAAQWYGRISVRNSTSDKSSFLGTYQGIAGVFAHNNALNAWADLYVNTVDGTNGGIVRMSADVRIGGNAALHAATTSAPSLSIGGNAATVTNATFYRQFTVRDDRSDGSDYSLAGRPTGLYAITAQGTNGTGAYYSSLIHVANGSDVAFQIAGGYNSDAMYFRGTTALQSGTGYSAWRTVLHNGNYTSYALPLAGGTLTGALSGTTASFSGAITQGGNQVLHAGNYGGYSTFSGIVSSASGGFQTATYAAGRNRIWTFGNADGYGINYYQGAGGISGNDVIGLNFGNATAALAQFQFLASGSLNATGTITATNFSGPGSNLTGTASNLNIGGTAYNITQYTINQSVGSTNSPTFATLQLTRLNFGATGATPYTSAAGEGFGNGITFGGDDNSAYYRIFTAMENVGGNYSKLTLNWHTGIRIGAFVNYGGVRFYNNSVGQGGTEIFSVGNLDSNVRVVNNLIVNGITINQQQAANARMYGATTGAFGLLGVDSAGSFRWQIYGDGTNYGFLDGVWAGWDIRKTVDGNLYLNDNSTYYLNPASLTNLLSLTVANTITGAVSGNAGTVTNGLYTTGGQTIAGITYFSNGESINAYGIRGRFTNEYLHLYNKVGVGHSGGWGQGETSTPDKGLSTYGGLNIAYGDNGISTFNGVIRANSNIRQGADLAMPLSSWSVSGTSTGMVIFSFPGNTGNYGMVHCVFDIYEYNSNTVSTVIVGGHNWNGAWYNTGANVIGRCGKSVRLGVKDSKFCVVFGGAASSWDYGTIVLRKIHNGGFYTGIMDMGGSFTTQQTTTESFSNISGDLRVLRTSTDFIADGGISGTTGTFSSDLSIVGQHQIRNANPTITFRDTNNRTAYIHVNADIFYLLTAVADSGYGSWGIVANSRWPLEINLSTNNAVFGADVNAISFTGSGSGLTGTAASLTAGAVPWSGITSKPTTLSGFGITDAASINGASNQTFSASGFYPYEWIRFMSDSGIYWQSGTYTGWHIHPQALWGMSFRSAATTDCGLQLRRSDATSLGALYADGTSIGFLNAAFGWGASFTIAGEMNRGSVPGSLVTGNISGSAGSVAWSGITSKPTTLAGFGITDALPLTGGTLTGALSGTTAAFSGAITQGGNQVLHAGNVATYAFAKSGAWAADLVSSYGYTRETGMQMSGGSEFVVLSKSGQGYLLVDGSYIAAEAGGFYSTNNSSGGTLLGFTADTTTSLNFNTTAVKLNGNQVLHAGNYSAYALPLTGGAITGNTTFSASNYLTFGPNSSWSRSLRIGGDGYTAPVTTTASVVTTNGNLHLDAAKAAGMGIYFNWYGGTGGVLFGNGSGSQVGAVDSSGNASFIGAITQNGSQVLHAGNVATYALPIGGGTLTGALTTSVGGTSIFIGNQNVTTSNGLRINFHTDADLNYYIGKKAGAWTQPLDINFYTGIRLYASSTYDYGISFWNSNNTTKMMSVGEGDSNVRVTNTLYIGGNTALHTANYNSYALPLTGGAITGAVSIIGQTVNGQTHYQWSGASFQNAGDWTASLIVRKDNATVGINGHIPSLVLYNNNGGDQTTVGLSFASCEGATGQGNAVPLAGIVARKEGAGTVGNWSSGSLNIYVKNGSARVDALNISSTGTANFPVGLQQNGSAVLTAASTSAPSLSIGGSAGSVAWTNVSGRPTAVSSFSNDSGYITSGSSISGSSRRIEFVDGPRNLSDRLPTTLARSVNWDFVGAATGNGAGNYAGVMTFTPWDGTSTSTGDSSYQLAFANQSGVNASGPAQLSIRNGINSTWNAWQVLLTSSNYTSYPDATKLPLTGGTLSGALNGTTASFSGVVDATQFRDSNDVAYFLDPAGTSNLNQWTTATAVRIGRSKFWTNRAAYHATTGYHTGTNGWGTDEGTWANAWKGGFSGWDIWGYSTDHPQGAGYMHAQGIVSGIHYSTDTGSNAYGWMMVGATNATDNRYWLRGKWDTSISGWVEMLTSGNYNSFSPTLTGTGASGNWAINATNITAYTINQSVGTGNSPSFTGLSVINNITGNVTGSATSISGFNNPTTAATVNTIVYRDSGGDIYGRYLFGSYVNSSDDTGSTGLTYIMAKFGNDYHRSATADKVAAFISGQTMNINGSSTSCSGTATTATTANALNTSNSYTISGLTNNGTETLFPAYSGGYSYFLRMGYDTSGYYDYTIKRNGSTGLLEFNGTQSAPYAGYVFSGGNVGIGTTTPGYKLDVNGNIHATAFPASSDIRFKKNITPLENSLEKVKKLQGVRYEWNEFINSVRDGYKLNVPIIGLIAQDVEKIVPEIIELWKLSDDCQDARSIDYPRLIPVLIEAIKEQQIIIENQNQKIENLISRVSALETK